MKILALAAVAVLIAVGAQSSFAADPDGRAAMTRGADISRGSQKEIEASMAGIVQSVLDRDFSDLVSHLSERDRDRVRNSTDNDFAAFKPVIMDLKKEWRGRYNEDINLDGAAIPYQITRNAGEKSATVTLLSGGSPITVRLVNEGTVGDDWRIDIPDSINGSQLKEALRDNVSKFSAQHASWPADRKVAVQQLAYSVFSALNGQQPSAGQGNIGVQGEQERYKSGAELGGASMNPENAPMEIQPRQ